MNDDLLRRFLPLFIDTATGRLARCRAQLEPGAPPAASSVRDELHALVGEASAVGVREVARLAREAHDADDPATLARLLGEIEAAVSRLSRPAS